MNLYTTKLGTVPLNEFAKDGASMLAKIFTAYSGRELGPAELSTLETLLTSFFQSTDKGTEKG
jgi:hypothetical protein